MSDRSDPEDTTIGRQLRLFVVASVRPRNPEAVSAAARAKKASRWTGVHLWARAPIGVLAALLLGGAVLTVATLGLNQGEATSPARALVNGVAYTVVVARSLVATPEDLSPYGLVNPVNPAELPFLAQGRTAFSVRGIDPQHALVVPLQPGQTDDFGAIGDYLLLVRGPDTFRELCPFFDSRSETRPTVCK